MTTTCGSVRWVHPTKSEAEFAPDQAECQQEAAQLFPPLYKASEIGDQNETSRVSSVNRCLRKRGWRTQRDAGKPAETSDAVK